MASLSATDRFYTRSRFLLLPADVQVVIMSVLPDLPTLQRLLTAFPSTVAAFIASFNTLVSTILKRSLHEELQQYVYAITSAHSAGPLDKQQLESFLDCHLQENAETNRPPAVIPRTQASLDYMVNVLEAIEFFLIFCILMFTRFARRSSFFMCPPEVAPTEFRIRRALLRFQLFSELFHQPGDPSDSISDWEERFEEQELFWTQYLPWEVEECKCIYALLVVCVRSNMIEQKPEPTHDEDSSQHRGLPQLRNFIEDTSYTKFGLSYVQRFLKKAFYGFSKVDPDDLNHFRHGHALCAEHFSQYPDCGGQNFRGRVCCRKRRWRPSSSPNPYLTEIIGDRKEVITKLRLLGWCFQPGECLYDYLPDDDCFLFIRS